MARRVAAGLVAILLLAGCSGDSDRSQNAASPSTTITGSAGPPPSQAPPTTAYPTYTVGTVVVPQVQIFDGPGEGESTRSLANPHPYYGTTRVLLVQEDKGEWLKVLLPMRPNGSTGWIRRSDVSLAQHDFRMVVDLNDHKLTVYEKADVIMEEPVGVGTGNTPTPGGLFYTTELLIPEGQPQYGPYAYGISGYSEVFYEFAGGDGQFGLHGTNDPSSVGRDASNGCLRLRNEAITKLAEKLPLGVPIEIRE